METMVNERDRIFYLDALSSHPGSPWLTMVVYLPPWTPGVTTRRVLAVVPEGVPALSFGDVELEPVAVHHGAGRWVDYGVARIPSGNGVQLGVRGVSPEQAARTAVVVATDLSLALSGGGVAEAERRLWGLSREEAGATVLSPARLPVGDPAAFHVRYTAGPRGLPAGAVLRFTVPRAFSWPQTSDPGAPGYTELDAEGAIAAIDEIAVSAESHEKVAILCRLPQGLPPGGVLALRYHTAFVYLFPCEWNATHLLHWYTRTPVLNVSVAIDDAHPFVYLAEGRGHTVRFVAGPPERLHLFLPGRRCAEESLFLRGVFTDAYRNPPGPGALDTDFELELRRGDERVGTLPFEDRFVAPHRFAVPLPPLPPGVYRVHARRRGSGATLACSNPLEIVPTGDRARRLFWGELHTHSEMSDGIGDFGGMYRHARDDGALDFVSGGDHGDCFTENQWRLMEDIAWRFDAPESFCALCGYEWGDHCVYSARRHLPVFRGGARLDLRPLLAFHAGDEQVVLGPHGHSQWLRDYEGDDPSVQRFVQVYSTWGACITPGGPLAKPPLNAAEDGGRTANDYLKAGRKLGFTGGGDIHCGLPGFSVEARGRQGEAPHDQYWLHVYKDGLTAAVSPTLDRAGIVGALRARRTYATSGARILLDFAVGGLAMGEEGEVVSAVCRAVVHAVAPLAAIEIVRDGEIVHCAETRELDVDVEWTDEDMRHDRDRYYYVQVRQQDGDMAWSSPVFVQCKGGE
jgi:hypothetical protein